MFLGLLYSRFFSIEGRLSSLPNCGWEAKTLESKLHNTTEERIAHSITFKPKKGNQLLKVVELSYDFFPRQKE